MSMSNGPKTEPRSSLPSPAAVDTTLLDLVAALCDLTTDDRLVVLAATHLINTRQVRLKGIFRDVRVIP